MDVGTNRYPARSFNFRFAELTFCFLHTRLLGSNRITVCLGQTDRDREYPKDKQHPEGTLRDSGSGVKSKVRSSPFEVACNLSLRICTAVAKTKHGHCVGKPK